MLNMQQFLNLLVRLFLSLSISFKSGVKKVPTTFFVIVCGKIVSSILEADFCWFSSGNEVLLRNILLLHFREATKCIPSFPFSATVWYTELAVRLLDYSKLKKYGVLAVPTKVPSFFIVRNVNKVLSCILCKSPCLVKYIIIIPQMGGT